MSLEKSPHLSGMILDSLLMGALSLEEAHTSAEQFQHQVQERSLERLRARLQQPLEPEPSWKRYALPAAAVVAALALVGALLALAS